MMSGHIKGLGIDRSSLPRPRSCRPSLSRAAHVLADCCAPMNGTPPRATQMLRMLPSRVHMALFGWLNPETSRLADSYTRYFLGYHESALLMVNVENLNFLDNDEHYELLLGEINNISSGRHYFNPII